MKKRQPKKTQLHPLQKRKKTDSGKALKTLIFTGLLFFFPFILQSEDVDPQKPISIQNEIRIFEAVSSDNLQRLIDLVAQGYSLEIEDSNGQNPLYYALVYRHWTIALYLLNQQSGLQLMNQTDSMGRILIEKFMEEKNRDILLFLLRHGADINGRNNSDFTIIQTAVKNNDPALIQFLIQNGADHMILNKKKQNLLHLAAEYGSRESLELLLYNFGEDFITEDKFGYLPIHYEYVIKNPSLIDKFTKAGWSMDLTAGNNWNALFFAVYYGYEESFAYLLKLGVNPELTDSDGNNLFHLCISYNRFGIFDILVEEGIYLESYNVVHLTPFLEAALEGRTEWLQKIWQAPELIFHQAGSSVQSFASYVIQEEKQSYRDYRYKRLLEGTDFNGRTALHLAVLSGNEKTVAFLIDKGFDVMAQDYLGNTALHFAVFNEYMKIVDLFRKYKNLWAIPNNNGQLPVVSSY